MNAIERIQQLRNEGKTGREIAGVLMDEGFSIQDAHGGFQWENYISHVEHRNELHVSDQPTGPDLATLIQSAEPRTLPSVFWRDNA